MNMSTIFDPSGKPLPLKLAKITEDEEAKFLEFVERQDSLTRRMEASFAEVEKAYEEEVRTLFKEMSQAWEELAKVRGYDYNPRKDIWGVDDETNEVVYIPEGRTFAEQMGEMQQAQAEPGGRPNLRLLKH